jgi:hypothetical protein
MTGSSAAKLRRLCLNAHLRTGLGLTYPRRYTVSVAQASASGERLRFVTLMIANRERHGDLHGPSNYLRRCEANYATLANKGYLTR